MNGKMLNVIRSSLLLFKMYANDYRFSEYSWPDCKNVDSKIYVIQYFKLI